MLRMEARNRERLWRHVIEAIESYTSEVEQERVTPELEPDQLQALLEPFDFEEPWPAPALIDFVVQGLRRHQTHTPHPRYFGLFNPAPTTMGVMADTLTAAFNPQLAAWSHSPLAIEIERHLAKAIAGKLGYPVDLTEGVFASGGWGGQSHRFADGVGPLVSRVSAPWGARCPLTTSALHVDAGARLGDQGGATVRFGNRSGPTRTCRCGAPIEL